MLVPLQLCGQRLENLQLSARPGHLHPKQYQQAFLRNSEIHHYVKQVCFRVKFNQRAYSPDTLAATRPSEATRPDFLLQQLDPSSAASQQLNPYHHLFHSALFAVHHACPDFSRSSFTCAAVMLIFLVPFNFLEKQRTTSLKLVIFVFAK